MPATNAPRMVAAVTRAGGAKRLAAAARQRAAGALGLSRSAAAAARLEFFEALRRLAVAERHPLVGAGWGRRDEGGLAPSFLC